MTQHSGPSDAGRVIRFRRRPTPEPAVTTTTLPKIRDMYNTPRVGKPLVQYDLARFSIVVDVQSPAREMIHEFVDPSIK